MSCRKYNLHPKIFKKRMCIMNNDKYIERTHKKIEAVLELYAAHIFRTVGTPD